MKKLFFLILFLCLIASPAWARLIILPPATVQESDGSPKINGAFTLKFPNGTLTQSGNDLTYSGTAGNVETGVSVYAADGGSFSGVSQINIVPVLVTSGASTTAVSDGAGGVTLYVGFTDATSSVWTISSGTTTMEDPSGNVIMIFDTLGNWWMADTSGATQIASDAAGGVTTPYLQAYRIQARAGSVTGKGLSGSGTTVWAVYYPTGVTAEALFADGTKISYYLDGTEEYVRTAAKTRAEKDESGATINQTGANTGDDAWYVGDLDLDTKTANFKTVISGVSPIYGQPTAKDSASSVTMWLYGSGVSENMAKSGIIYADVVSGSTQWVVLPDIGTGTTIYSVEVFVMNKAWAVVGTENCDIPIYYSAGADADSGLTMSWIGPMAAWRFIGHDSGTSDFYIMVPVNVPWNGTTQSGTTPIENS